ncbi:DEKNAAC104120 [Brettanomyces naardenensis]|uniref:DEKNAAC104120 n=1 Tax=Brettanomyces naardenensis TaxID=13370 RepID=A0A448YQ78_BRENA|nr:DEKNAAC104120 [Brettanomyces naardenensis]
MSLPISYDATSKKVKLLDDVKLSENRDLESEVEQLNTLVKDYINTNSDVPGLPTPQAFTKNLSLMVKKMHASSTNLMRQKKFKDAAKQYSIALGLALARPKFENFQLTMSEVVICLMGRCDALMMEEDWLSAYQDAEILCQLAAAVADNHLRKGICELKLGNALDAKADFERGLCFKPGHEKLKEHLKIVERVIAEENGESPSEATE